MNLQICRKDYNTLHTLLSNQNTSIPFREKKLLLLELSKMAIVDDQDAIKNVIQLNSKVTILDIDKQIVSAFTITLPSQANIKDKKVSVLAPISIALLGEPKNKVIEWKMPGGIKRLKITDVGND